MSAAAEATFLDLLGDDAPREDTLTITQPGVYDIPAEVYHRDPVAGGSLSSTGARKLLPPSCPAKYRWWVDHPDDDDHARHYDIGSAAHKVVLGAGPELAIIDAADYRTKAARQERDAAYAAGYVPVLAAEYDTVQAMATALQQHPIAARLLDPTRGRTEQTLIWRDPETGVSCRALLDYLPDTPNAGHVYVIADYKTSKSAAPEDLPRTVWTLGYHQQLDWYLDAVRHTGAAGDAPIAAVLIVQEREPPYLITVAQPDRTALGVARTRNRKARDVYRQCVAADHWPGYADDVIPLALPAWAEWQHKDAAERGDFDLTTNGES